MAKPMPLRRLTPVIKALRPMSVCSMFSFLSYGSGNAYSHMDTLMIDIGHGCIRATKAKDRRRPPQAFGIQVPGAISPDSRRSDKDISSVWSSSQLRTYQENQSRTATRYIQFSRA